MYFSMAKSSLAPVLVVLLMSSWQGSVNCDQQQSAIVSNEVGVTNTNGNKPQSSNSFASPSAATIPEEQYRATYFYPNPHQVNWNRDTYADAATEFGYNSQQQGTNNHGHGNQHGAATALGPVYTPAYGSTGSDIEGYDDSGFGGGAFGGLGGLAGILGLKGLKGLGLLGLAKAAVPILFVLLPALLLIPLLLVFFPIPVITVPATPGGRKFLSTGFSEISGKMSNLARSVLESDKCVERISCEVSRVSRGTLFDKTLKRVIPRFEPHLPQALQRIARVYMEGGSPTCGRKYTCYFMDDGSSSANDAKKSS